MFQRKLTVSVRRSQKSLKNHYKSLFWGSGSFKVRDAGTPGKLVSSACYDTQEVCLSATVLVLD